MLLWVLYMGLQCDLVQRDHFCNQIPNLKANTASDTTEATDRPMDRGSDTIKMFREAASNTVQLVASLVLLKDPELLGRANSCVL